jgi:hypothetical protein
VALAVTGHLGFLAEAWLTGDSRPRIANHLYGGSRGISERTVATPS